MFCYKCGNQIPEGAGFCQKCGARLLNSSAQQTPPLGERANECTIQFLPKKIFGQCLAHKATIVANGKRYTTKFRKKIEFQINSGNQTLHGYTNYLGETCKFTITHNFEAGKKYLIRYRTPLFVFFNGKVTIEEM
jgi:hypothetical protein